MAEVKGVTTTKSLGATLGVDEEDPDALIAAMMQMAEKGAEPGDMLPGDVLHRGDAPEFDEVGQIKSYPVPIVAGSIKSAGYVTIFDTKTGEPSLTNRNMLPTQLKKVHEDGTRAFDVRPRPRTRVGKTICLLHSKHEDRAHYDELGFPACKKDNLLNPFQRDRHMESRHKAEWAAIQEERRQAEKDEDRAFQRRMITGLQKQIKASKG